MAQTGQKHPPKGLTVALLFVGLVVAAMGSLGAPLVPTVAKVTGVSLSTAQWTLTISLLVGAVMTPVLARLGDGPYRRQVILGTLWVVLIGSMMAALPLGFTGLLIGRALQGSGLGLTALVIGVAKDHFEGEKAQRVISLLSVTSLAGVGLGYPISGGLTEFINLRAAYSAGVIMAAVAIVLAYRSLPQEYGRQAPKLDSVGAGLLGIALGLLLYALTQVSGSKLSGLTVAGMGIVSLLLLAVWAWYESCQPEPLVKLNLVAQPAVLLADVSVLLAGIGMYLLLATVIRYVQTPATTTYGFGASVFVTGLMLTPFSALSFVASHCVPVFRRKMNDRLALALSAAIVLVPLLGFALFRDHLWEAFIWIGIAGYGVGAIYAVVPALIIDAVPAAITTSAIGFNQVLRTIGFSIGSALAALVLQMYTPQGAVLPLNNGYTMAAIVGITAIVMTLGATLLFHGQRLRRKEVPTDEELLPVIE